ncbi:MAG: 4-(cytidine 5'-diphospho)-2-C-methyl-D-erythritol kinase [Gemmatimonadales bacterium]
MSNPPAEPVVVPAAAKVNLFLRVLSREADGWHGIETLFCRLALADELVAEPVPGDEVTLTVEGPDTGPVEDNLAVRAAREALRATGRRFGVRLTLRKRIPIAAGLGGGSADAAAALEAVNRLAGDAIPRSELMHAAARLGADVPFCLSGAPLALGWGHGERLLRLPALPQAPVLLLSPDVSVRTAEAYAWVAEARASAGRRGALVLDTAVLSSWSDVARMAGNDFESAVFGRFPAVRGAFEALAETRPLLCRMSGSGSTIFAVYRNPRDREDARARLGRKHGTIILTETA